MASKINYNNKAPFQTLEEIPDENKVNASDMNEIKTVVNNNADELDTAKENIENLENGQGTSNAEITSLKTRVSALETDNSTNKTNISNLEENKVDKVEGKGLSTEDFTTVLKSKLEGLENYDDTEIKEDISNLEAGQTEQDKQIDMLINALPTETQEAENINIKGTIPVKFKEFKVSGNSKQQTRSGKNLLKNNLTDTTINGVTFKINEDKSITVNGTATANIIANLVSGQYNDNNADEPLTIPDDVTNLRLSGCPTGGSSSTYKLDLYNSDYILLATDFGNGTSVIIPEENKNISRARIIIYSGATVNNLTFKPMLEKGTTATDYEQYGAMPSPEYPSPIQNVEGDVNITVYNKNLADPEEVWENMQAYNSNYCSEVVEDGKECIRFLNSSFRPDVANPFNLINYKYKENTSYTIRGMFKKDGDTEGQAVSFVIVYTDGTKEFIVSSGNAWQELRIVSNAQKTIQRIGFSFGSYAYWFLDKSSLFIAEGDTTDYVEHQEQTVTFPLAQGQKLMLGDYLADDGIHHVRKQVEVNGTELVKIEQQNDNFARAYTNKYNDMKNYEENDNYTPASNFICSHFESVSNYLLVKICVALNDQRIYITISKDIASTISEFKSYLAEQKQAGTPVILEYELAEEEIEAYTEEQQEAYNQLKQLTAYEEETNIYSTNEVGPVFTVTAVKDINSVITQLNTVLLERS